ncbi:MULTISPECIES: caspase domain-containing protein [unclassified Bradyrhizobium]|uniref:caspase family protein n=1 Tax=unclassified Bradyrhizobium TaxID=2631580 RepID=UPI002916A54F|nr:MULTISPECIES: caspase family protein [unclassified Bradyrhizobium]
MSSLRPFLTFLFALWVSLGPAYAEKRVALVIGNSAYKNVPQLLNPANDAALVGGMFKRAGFDSVEIKTDLNAVEMRRVLREFGGRTREAAIAIIYYAGHGIELDGTNYLIPTDARLETDSDVLDETLPLDRALFAVEPARQLRLIILDACRDNPFAKTMKRTLASRGIGRGLAKVEPTNPNTMIAFAAKAGSTASDGALQNSPFAAALVDRLPTPGLDLRKAFGFVRDDVLKSTGYQQEPYVYGSLGGDDIPLVPTKPVAAGPQASPQDAVRRDYELALQAGDRDAWDAFLRAYPDGFYADLAKVQLKKIAAEKARVAATEKAREAEEEKARLAADGVRKAEREKAAAAAKAAEVARLAAEKAKDIQDTKAAAAEQRRKEVEATMVQPLIEMDATKKMPTDGVISDKAAAESVAKEVTDKQAAASEDQKAATLTMEPSQRALSSQETAKLVQRELRRVGCLTAAADGDWNATSQRSLSMFNKYAGAKLDAKLASFDALDAVKAKQGRICPLVCEHGFKAKDDSCVKITCREGFEVGNDNTCGKIVSKKPTPEERKDQQDRPGQTRTAAELMKQFTNVPTCSNIRAACEKSLSPGHCASSFTQCMQTGKWKSGVSQYEGLARR